MEKNIKLHPSTIPNQFVRFIPSKKTKTKAFSSITERFPRPKQIAKQQLKEYTNVHQPKSLHNISQSTLQQSTPLPPQSHKSPQIIQLIPPHKTNLITLWQDQPSKQQEHLIKKQLKEYNYQLNRKLRSQHIRKRIEIAQGKKKELERLEIQHYREVNCGKEMRKARNRKTLSYCFCTTARSNPTPNNQELGPGAYHPHTYYQPLATSNKPNPSSNPNLTQTSIPHPNSRTKPIRQKKKDFKSLAKYHLQQLLKEQEECDQKMEIQEKSKKNREIWPQFVVGDHDRFGDSMYPIVDRSSKPGPGYYDNHKETIQNRFNRIRKIQNQKQALRNWFNNNNSHIVIDDSNTSK